MLIEGSEEGPAGEGGPQPPPSHSANTAHLYLPRSVWGG
jgi:hypothetical protein